MPQWNFQGSIIHKFQLAQATAAPAAMVMLTNGTNYEQIYHDDDDDEKQQINLKYSNYV